MPFIKVRESNLHYLEVGKGKPIICFHSTPASAQFYRSQLDYFGHGYHVIAVDLRGHGDSDKPRGPYRMSEFFEDYIGIFDAFNAKRFVLIGCSVGGIIAQLYALKHGDNLRGLVLVGSPCSRRGRDVAGFHEAVRKRGWEGVVRGLVDRQFHRTASPELKEWAVREYLKTPVYVREAEEEALLAEVHHTDRVHEISTPTLLVAGEEEEREIYEQMELMSRRIQNAEWHVVKGAAHVPNLERASEFNVILERFLRRIDY